MMQDNRNVFEIEQIDAPVSSAVFTVSISLDTSFCAWSLDPKQFFKTSSPNERGL